MVPRLLAFLLILPLVSLGLAEPAPAQDAELVADIAPEESFASGPTSFLNLGNKVVYLDAVDRWPSLWATDGTPQGTEPLGYLCPACGYARALGTTRELAFFVASESYVGLGETTYIWRTDGTPAGTFPVTGPFTTPQSGPGMVAATGDHLLYFTACTPAQGCELWVSDGTARGTGPVADLVPGPGSLLVREMVTIGDIAWFLGRGPGGMGLWRVQGPLPIISRVRDLPTLARPRLLTRTGDRLFFLAEAGGLELWRSDGTTDGTLPVTRFLSADPFRETRFLKEIDGRVYFLADDGGSGVELWSTDGTSRGARRITDFAYPLPFSLNGEPFEASSLASVGGRLLFSAYADGHQSRLWTSRGRLRTTAPLTGCPAGCPVTRTAYFSRLGGRWVFNGYDDAHGWEPWVTDGTSDGTRRLAEVIPGPDSAYLRAFTSAAGRVWFERFIDQGEPGDLWVTDGTAAGTRFLAKDRPGETHYAPFPAARPLDLAGIGGKAIFMGYDDQHGFQPWVSDGSPAGTSPLAAPTIGEGSWPSGLAAFGEHVLFTACRDQKTELWASGGTAATTVRIVDALLDSCSFDLQPGAAPLGDAAIFRAGSQIWRTDGTAAGTLRLMDFSKETYVGPPLAAGGKVLFSVIAAGAASYWSTDGTPQGTRKLVDLPGYATYEAAAGSQVFFLEAEYLSSRVWRTDGTAAGTYPLTSINSYPTTAALPVPGFLELGGRVYFLTFVDNHGPEIWSTDGTPQGTRRAVTPAAGYTGAVDGLESEGGLLWFRARRAGSDPRPVLWRSDGTEAGTFPLPADLSDGVLTPYYRDRFAAIGSRVFFQATDPVHGAELWSSDGTPEGTRMVRDLFPGLPDSHPLWLAAAGGRVWFAANSGPHGTELWSTDGTAEGTREETDIAPGALWSEPMWLTPADGTLYFSADDVEHGRELWKVPVP